MNNSNIAIKNPEDVCFNCLKETKVNKIYIDSLGYSSGFDNFSTRINLCDDCIKQTNKDWWKLEKKQCDWDDTPESEDNYNKFFKYKYEDEILAYVKQLPLAGQELFYSRFAYGACADNYMSGQDWIDYRLGILPHEKCKEYGYFSPQEKEAYNKKFPICDKVKFIIYEDGSKGCRCPFGAFGNKDGTSEGYQTQSDCYECKMFKTRDGNIETITKEDFDIYELQNKLALKLLLKNQLKNVKC